MAKFQKGQSGNPAGRPKGVVDQRKLRAAVADDMPEVIEKVVAAAKSGDMQACKLLLDRVLPPLRPLDASINLPLEGKNLVEDGQLIIQAIGAGELSINQAAQLMTAMGTLARVKEIDELERRLIEVEKMVEAQSR